MHVYMEHYRDPVTVVQKLFSKSSLVVYGSYNKGSRLLPSAWIKQFSTSDVFWLQPETFLL